MPQDDQPTRFVLVHSTLPGFEGYPYWIPAEDEVAPPASEDASDPWTALSGNAPAQTVRVPESVGPVPETDPGVLARFAALRPVGDPDVLARFWNSQPALWNTADPWAAYPDWPPTQALPGGADLLAAYPELHAWFFASQAPGNAAWSVNDLPPTGTLFSAPSSFGGSASPQASSDPWAAFPDWPPVEIQQQSRAADAAGTGGATNFYAAAGNDLNNPLNLPASVAAASVAGGNSSGTNAPYAPLQTGLNALGYAFRHSADPELADAENLRYLVENHPQVAAISGGVGLATALGIPLAFYLSAILEGALARAAAAKALSPAEQLAKNRAAGNAFERTTASGLEQKGLRIGPQMTVRTESGVQVRMDFVTRDPLTGKFDCIECKASPTARLTPNQTLAFPEIDRSGGTIVGAGKPDFPRGMQIPPTKVRILRGP